MRGCGGLSTFAAVEETQFSLPNDKMSDYIQTLNPTQHDAVVNYQGASLIIAGAGSGKTRVLTCRIAYMLSQGVPASSILALTFTNKAAREMRERIDTLVPGGMSRRLWMSTFHSIFARILRAEADKLGYPSSFTIYDASDAKNLVKLAIKELNLSDETYKPNNIAARISKAKNNLVTPQAYEANSSLQAEDRELRIPQFLDIYKLYMRKCRENGAMDFDDLLLNTNILMRDRPDVLAKYQEQFRYILVDEYQDTNFAQYVIIRQLGARHGNVCVVGDDAQSIYSFRGAKIENILRFQQDFPGAKLFKLEQNYRSTQTIVNAANCVIEKNQRQIRKKSFSAAEKGEKIRVMKAYTDKEESSLLASDIYTTVRTHGAQFSDIAILYRTNAQSRALEEALRTRNIPYKIYGGMSFYQRKEVKDLLAYVRLVVNPRDDEALRRIINTPARGIGEVTISKIAAAATAHNLSMWEAVSTLGVSEIGLSGAAANKVAQFAKMIGELSEMRATTEAYTLGLEIATRSGLIGTYKMQQTPESISALENIEELLNSIRSYVEDQERAIAENTASDEAPVPGMIQIDEWLQNVSLLTDMDNEKPEEFNKVTLMTVHSAKGLEFEYVYIAGLEENLFPSLMSLGSPEGLEEERRLFYVALTRAKRAAVLSFAESRFKWGEMSFSRPSRFLGEIDPCYLDVQFDLDCDPEEDEDSSSTYGRTAGGYGRGAHTYGTSRTGYDSTRSSYGDRSQYGGYTAGSGRSSYGGSGNTRNGSYGSSRNGSYQTNGTAAPRTYYPSREQAPQRVEPLKPGGRLRSIDARPGGPLTNRPTATGYAGHMGISSTPQGMGQPRTATSFPGGTAGNGMGNAAGSNMPFSSGAATSPAASTSSNGGALAVGTRVVHAKFGQGTIVAIEEWSNDTKLTVDFGPAGRKVLLQKFARLQIL